MAWKKYEKYLIFRKGNNSNKNFNQTGGKNRVRMMKMMKIMNITINDMGKIDLTYTVKLISGVPMALEIVPQPCFALPRVRGNVPQPCFALPRVRGTVPQPCFALPRVRGNVPQSCFALPRVRGTVLRLPSNI
jgi:hypothetical protein